MKSTVGVINRQYFNTCITVMSDHCPELSARQVHASQRDGTHARNDVVVRGVPSDRSFHSGHTVGMTRSYCTPTITDTRSVFGLQDNVNLKKVTKNSRKSTWSWYGASEFSERLFLYT